MKWFIILCITLAVTANNNDFFVRSNKQISVNLYKGVADTHNGSFITCPGSLQVIFNFISMGARGKTAEELASVLLLPNDPGEIQNSIEKLMKQVKKLNKQHAFNIVNKMYVQKSFEIAPTFKDIAVEIFKTDIENMDFKDRQRAADEINQWVSDKTNNNIRGLITKYDVSENTPAVLVNTIYLEATWNDRFSSVKPEIFNLSKNKQVVIDMMEQEKQLMYYEDGDLKAKFLKLKYLKSDVVMIVVLPYEIDGLSHLEANIDRVLQKPKFQNKKVHVKLPKFETTNSVELIPILQKWGITDLFKPQANLKGIGVNQEAFYINQILQKNFIRVHENGTSVASATIAIPRLGARRGQVERKEFIADHPFIYYITWQDGIIFTGRFAGN
ncbi:hypothetical protein RN001_010931 [Aquatica leii]|uniref:Serpin domain-containing protein n=1 Tax=Aquatica leii TaxID=1421715 RepID=A0AAN7P1P0_9COLE|nr:hypothetical protein RN001_010931 [Aquatica leii]